MKPSKWGPSLMLVAALASLIPAPLLASGGVPSKAGERTQAPARMLAASSLEKLLDLQAGHPQLLEQKAGTEGGITLWYVLIGCVAVGVIANAAYQKNRNFFSNISNNLSSSGNNNNSNGNSGGNGGTGSGS